MVRGFAGVGFGFGTKEGNCGARGGWGGMKRLLEFGIDRRSDVTHCCVT